MLVSFSGPTLAGNKVVVVMAVFAGFQGLFLAAAAWAKRTAKTNRELLDGIPFDALELAVCVGWGSSWAPIH